MKFIKLNVLIFFIIIFCFSCEDYYNKRVVFTLQSIIVDRSVVGRGESVNISAIVTVQGMVNQNDVKYNWDCIDGAFNDKNKQATIWTAPSDNTGEFLLRLRVSFMGNTEEGEVAIKVVRTPADNWGSLSGNILDELKSPLDNIIVIAKTGESDTSDIKGLFYIEYIPQGGTGLEFSNIGFKWVTEPLDQIDVIGGNHKYLGSIILYESKPPVIQSYDAIPNRQAIITINHDQSDLFEYFELYTSYNPDGSDLRFLSKITPGTTTVTVTEAEDSAYIALKSIPFQGEESDFSPWTKIHFTDVIDPNREKTSIEYRNFFETLIAWEPTGYEDYYEGFRIAKESDTGLTFLSHLLSTSTFQYSIITTPGMTDNFYVISITKTHKYNLIQSSDQRITLEVPYMEFPSGFKGKFNTIDGINVKLSWEPIANNNTWYSGYLIEKKTITASTEYDWEELVRITSSLTGSYIDFEVDTANIYNYSIRTMTYPPVPGNPEYSLPDTITVELF